LILFEYPVACSGVRRRRLTFDFIFVFSIWIDLEERFDGEFILISNPKRSKKSFVSLPPLNFDGSSSDPLAYLLANETTYFGGYSLEL
jgi:hypothetical protein